MAIQTFGLTYLDIQTRLGNTDLAEWSDRIDGWIELHSSSLDAVLKNQGSSAATAYATGAADPFFKLCAAYIALKTTSEAAVSLTRADPEAARKFDSSAETILDRIVDHIESLEPDYDPDEGRATFRAGIRTSSAGATTRRRSRRWRRGMPI
jgi:hypothetical protein